MAVLIMFLLYTQKFHVVSLSYTFTVTVVL